MYRYVEKYVVDLFSKLMCFTEVSIQWRIAGKLSLIIKMKNQMEKLTLTIFMEQAFDKADISRHYNVITDCPLPLQPHTICLVSV